MGNESSTLFLKKSSKSTKMQNFSIAEIKAMRHNFEIMKQNRDIVALDILAL